MYRSHAYSQSKSNSSVSPRLRICTTNRPCTMVMTAAAAVIVLTYCHCFSNNRGSVTAQELVYPGQAKSERDLSTCEPYEICSVVHKRYWLANKVERLCRCDGQECPSSWAASPDGADDEYTMMLNNRAQMKFCEPVTALPNCLESGAGAGAGAGVGAGPDWNNTQPQPRPRPPFLNVVNETRAETFNNVTAKNYKLSSKAECYCPPRNTWIAHAFQKNESLIGAGAAVAVSYTRTSYRCAQLTKCKSGDMCGFERADFYSNYYKCSCPYGHLCLRQNQSVVLQVNEMLYEGPAFVTHCQNNTGNNKRRA